eukprot:353524-Chlamydomonas_euryale.AAC.1
MVAVDASTGRPPTLVPTYTGGCAKRVRLVGPPAWAHARLLAAPPPPKAPSIRPIIHPSCAACLQDSMQHRTGGSWILLCVQVWDESTRAVHTRLLLRHAR